MRFRLIILSSVFFLHALLCAHDINTSYFSLEIVEDGLTCNLRIDQSDLVKIFDLDENGDNAISKDEFLVNLDHMYDYFAAKIQITVAGEALALERVQGNLFEDELGNVFLDFLFESSLQRRPWKVAVGLAIFDDFGPKHKNLAKVTYGAEVQQTIFTIGNPEQSFSFAGRGVSLLDQVIQFVWLGMEHIFIGYDHILFLVGLIVIGGSLTNLVKIVTSFTLAHSLTLILASLQIVMIPSRVVESVIALSIVYITVENLLIKDSNQRWMISFIFGLMHGFGFARVLTELGLPTAGLVASLLAFNIGVEIGQMAIVLTIFPVVLLISRSRWQRQWVYGISSLILVFGLTWFVERAFGLDSPMAFLIFLRENVNLLGPGY